MSDYKRFVAYLYEYHEQQKGENRGFVRVEVRNGTCQMAFQIKVFSLPEGSALNVYGFVRIKNFLYGIPVGILRAARNGITGRLMTPSVHMGDSTFSLNELGGLILFGAEKRIFATQWDDIAIRPNQFTTDAAVLKEPQLTAADTHASDCSEEDNSSEPAAVQAASIPETATEDSSRRQHSAQAREDSDTPLQIQTSENSDSVPQAASSGKSLPERWQNLLNTCPHMRPFDDDEITECIRLDLKDLPQLRKNGWQVGSSQFLLHGFYNYRHLLMGRLADGNTDTYVFGVPGIFDVKEQFMAGMFGFSSFKPARLSQNTPGTAPFGYWYRPVQ